jgi:hypothetical protein
MQGCGAARRIAKDVCPQSSGLVGGAKEGANRARAELPRTDQNDRGGDDA